MSNGDRRLIDWRGPGWFDFARRVILFVLGVYAICYALVTSGHDVAFLVTGLILTSVVSIEDALDRMDRRRDTGPPALHRHRPTQDRDGPV